MIENGDIPAGLLYANMLLEGDGVPADKKDAAKLFKIASDRGMNDASFQYSMIMYEEGNKEEAAQYFKKTADRGHPIASYRYGMMLYNGEGTDVNKQESAKYIKLAAQGGVKETIDHYIDVLQNGVRGDC